MATLFHRIGKWLFFGRYQRPWRWPAGIEAETWERVSFPSSSGAQLAGVLGSPEGATRAAVVLAHPMGLAAKGFWLKHGHAQLLRSRGFAVLAFDFNGFGESESGNFDYPSDVLAAGEYLRHRYPTVPIVALGASFGAGYTVCALARDDHPFGAAVLEATFPSLPHYWRQFVLPSAALKLSQVVYPKLERDLRPILAARCVKRSPRVLLIHGTADTITPPEVGQQLKSAMSGCASVELWVTPGATHNLAFSAAAEAYADRVMHFLQS